MPVPNVMQFRSWVTVTPLLQLVGVRTEKQYDEAARRKHRARIVQKPQVVRVTQGEELAVDVQAWIVSAERPIQVTDRIELPDGSTPTVVRVYAAPDGRGKTRVFRVLFGASRRTGSV